jgi:hypothetical protein
VLRKQAALVSLPVLAGLYSKVLDEGTFSGGNYARLFPRQNSNVIGR